MKREASDTSRRLLGTMRSAWSQSSLAPAPALLEHSDAVMQRRDHVGCNRIEILERELCHVSPGHAGPVQKPAQPTPNDQG